MKAQNTADLETSLIEVWAEMQQGVIDYALTSGTHVCKPASEPVGDISSIILGPFMLLFNLITFVQFHYIINLCTLQWSRRYGFAVIT